MYKDKIERICREAGMQPESRERLSGDYELFLADGFSLPPHRVFWFFDVEPDDFPKGMYATLWWISKGSEKLDTGQPIFLPADHPDARNKAARLELARKTAVEFIKTRKKNSH